MTRRSPWTVCALDVLADGAWHTRDELVAAAGPLVPPGHAARTAERTRAGQRSRHGTPAPTARARPSDVHAHGRRAIVVKSLGQLAAQGTLEHDRARARYRLTRGER